MVALAAALRGTGAVLQMISDCYQSIDPDYVAAELDLMAAMAQSSGRPLSFSVQQPPGGSQPLARAPGMGGEVRSRRSGRLDPGGPPAHRGDPGPDSQREPVRGVPVLRRGRPPRRGRAGTGPDRAGTGALESSTSTRPSWPGCQNPVLPVW